MLLHAAGAFQQGFSTVIINSPDTDVLIVLAKKFDGQHFLLAACQNTV